MRAQVIVFIPSFESGGVERNAVHFANGMVASGFDVHVLYCRSTDSWFSRLDERVNKVWVSRRLALPLLPDRIVDAANMLLFAPSEIRRICRVGRAAVVSFQSNVVAIALARRLGIPVAVRISNHFVGSDYEKSLVRKAAEFSKRRCYRFADVVVANSTELAADYGPLLRKDVETIPNPIDLHATAARVEGEVSEAPFADKRRPIIISVGRLVAQKNYALMVRAMVAVVARVPCDLVIVGEGSERKNLERLIADLNLTEFVHLLGHRDNVGPYLRRSDLFVLSSLYEGMPNALIEAVSCGLPAVATRCKTGPAEVLCEGDGGRLVPVDDPIALAEAIAGSILDPADTEKRRRIAVRNLGRYDHTAVMEKYVLLVQRLLLRYVTQPSRPFPSR